MASLLQRKHKRHQAYVLAMRDTREARPNPRLQRTRSAPLRSPLSFEPLGHAVSSGAR